MATLHNIPAKLIFAFTSPRLALCFPLDLRLFSLIIWRASIWKCHTQLDSIRFLSVSGGGSKNSERHLRMINSIMIMISIFIIIYYLSWSLSEMESKYLCLCKPTHISVYSTDSIHIYRGKFIVASCDRLRWQTTYLSDADIIATLMDPCDRVLHVPGAPMHPQNIYIYIGMYIICICAWRHRSSIYLSIWSLIDPLTLLCPNSSGYLLWSARETFSSGTNNL